MPTITGPVGVKLAILVTALAFALEAPFIILDIRDAFGWKE